MPGVLVSLGAAIVVVALCAPPALSQSANPATGAVSGTPSSGASGQIEPAAAFVAELTKSIDARKARPGDPVPARLTMDVLAHGHIVAPRGTQIVGHVTAATARTRDVSGAQVAIAFDRIAFRNGFELPLQATIRAIGAPLRAALPDASSDVDLPDPRATRPPMGPNEWQKIRSSAFPGSRRPDIANGPVVEANSPGKAVGPALGPASEGVVGIKGIELTSSARSSAISSTRGNFHLSGGTQLVLRISDPKLLLDSLEKNRDQSGLVPGR